MQWYEKILDQIEYKRAYHHKELADKLQTLRPEMSKSSYHGAIRQLLRTGALTRQGYDLYYVSTDQLRNKYTPAYSEPSRKLIKLLSQDFPHVQFTLFETVLLNEFLNHLIAQNTIFVQVEKESSIYIFRHLQEQEFENLLYKPKRKDLDLYWSKDCIIVTDMISEAPLRTDEPHTIMLEKMLVDVLADRLIAGSYSPAEIPDMMEQAQSRYLLDTVRLLRYARRRNKK